MSTLFTVLAVLTYMVIFTIVSIVAYNGALLWLDKKFKQGKEDKEDETND